ncbi:MAG: metal-dependent hydrolase [bacterium]
MENLAHSLVGASFAELALPAGASTAHRRIFFTAGVIAANLPDADLLYTRIMAPPLGYSLHHRGHTHTLVGLVVQWMLVALVCSLPAIRTAIAPVRARFWTLVAASLLSHIVLDSWNSYGVHPFYPFDNRWFYGDAVSVVEPWLWVLLGVAVAVNTKNRYGRLVVAGLIVGLPFVFVRVGFVSIGSLIAPVVIGAALALFAVRVSPRARTITALASTALFVISLFGLKQVARARVLARASADTGGEIVDMIMSPKEANPLCWTTIVVAKNESLGTFSLRRGVVAVARGWGGARCDEWNNADVQSLTRLRDLARDDCWVRAWLEFGRAPYIEGDEIADYRFGNRRGNFSGMTIVRGRGCPAYVPGWGRPRRDLLRSTATEGPST